MAVQSTSKIRLTVRGDVRYTERLYLLDKIDRVLTMAPGLVLDAHLVLTESRSRRVTVPIRVEIEVRVNGERVLARLDATTPNEAADLLQERLRGRFARLQDQIERSPRIEQSPRADRCTSSAPATVG
jgi:ribosome-associated translation inhibitor RaiA